MNEQEPTYNSITWSTWLKLVAGVVALIFVVFILALITPTLEYVAPVIGYVFAGTLIIAIPGALVTGVWWLHGERKNRNLQARIIRPNANNVYGAVFVESEQRFIQAVNGELPQVVPDHYAPTISNHYHNDVGQFAKLLEMGRSPVIEEAASDYLPEPYSLSDVLQRWQPSKDGILLAKKQELITVPAGEGLCHTIFTGSTDGGKTNNERALLVQLLFLEQIVYLCDRNYQRFRKDQKRGLYYDYGPIENLLRHEPITSSQQCLQLLKELYSGPDGVEDRRARRRHNKVDFPDIYLVMDELPAFCADEPGIMEYVGRFLREARQYGIFFIGAAQDLLNETLNSDNGATRENILTAYYGGGDMTTARKILNLKTGEKIDETGLGSQGITYLRAKGASIEHVKARVAYSDEQATHMLLGDRRPAFERVTLGEKVYPTQQPEKRIATYDDAVKVWNDYYQQNPDGPRLGRPRLREMLLARGLECTDDRAKQLIAGINRRLQEDQNA